MICYALQFGYVLETTESAQASFFLDVMHGHAQHPDETGARFVDLLRVRSRLRTENTSPSTPYPSRQALRWMALSGGHRAIVSRTCAAVQWRKIHQPHRNMTMERKSRISGYFDDDMNWIGPAHSPEAMRRAEQLYREGLRRQQPAGDRVEYGRNDHHREFTNICTGRILYDAGLVPLENLSRSARDEIGGNVNLIAMMRDYISLAGNTPPPIDDKNAIITRALGSSDFPSLVNNILNKSLIAGFDTAPECWPAFTKYAPVNDFKSIDFPRGASMPAPPEVIENGEVKPATLYDDGKESDYIRSHVHRVSVSRQALMNSDTTALAAMPYQAGVAVSRAIGNGVFNLLINNAALGDGVALFHADHGNLETSGAPPSVTTLEAAFVAMGAQQNGAGEYLNYKPHFIISGPAYTGTLAVIRPR